MYDGLKGKRYFVQGYGINRAGGNTGSTLDAGVEVYPGMQGDRLEQSLAPRFLYLLHHDARRPPLLPQIDVHHEETQQKYRPIYDDLLNYHSIPLLKLSHLPGLPFVRRSNDNRMPRSPPHE